MSATHAEMQPASPQNVERLKFTVDDGAINHFIHAQNGTLSTAIRELVMNAIDAGSTACHIVLKSDFFSVQDFGKGFADRNEVVLKFGHFAEDRDNSDSVYARFRIGRGQCMSLASMVWRSNTFKISTDIHTHGNTYELESDLPMMPGCLVEGQLYRPMSEWHLRQLKEELNTMFQLAQIEITVNSLSIRRPFPDNYWDIDNDEFCIKYDPPRRDDINLYNLGVFVKALPFHYYGFSADVVSKKALMLNMARNEVHENDPIFPKIRAILKERAIWVAKEKQRKQKMDEVTRRNLIARFLAGDISFDDVIDFAVLRECRGHYLKLNSLWNNKIPLTIALPGMDLVASRLASARIAQVLHPDELRIWQVNSADDLLQAIVKLIPKDREHRFYHSVLPKRRTADFLGLCTGIRDTHTVIKPSKLTVPQRATLNSLNYISKIMAARLDAIRHDGAETVKTRKILPGDSDTAMAWTDGAAMIAFDAKLLTLPERGIWGVYQLCQIMLHEYSHNDPNMESHNHDFAFYQYYHDVSLHCDPTYEVVGHCINSFISRYVTECQKHDLPIPDDFSRYRAGAYLFTYTLNFEGPRQLNPFHETLLKTVGFAVAKRGKAWQLRFNEYRQQEGKMRLRLMQWINNLLLEQGLPTLPRAEDAPVALQVDVRGLRHLDQPRFRWLEDARRQRLLALCNTMGWHSDYQYLINPRYQEDPNCFSDPTRFAEAILSLVCADPSNDLASFRAYTRVERVRFGTAQATLDLSLRQSRTLEPHFRSDYIPADPNTVQRAVLKQMADAVNSLDNPELRAQFIETFIPEHLAIAMGIPK